MTDREAQDITTVPADAPPASHEVPDAIPLPWGAQPHADGVNFSVFSRNATRIRLEFHDRPGDPEPSRVFDLDPKRHRTGDVWHVWVRGVESGQLYAYRVEGPWAPAEGHRFNPRKLLLDPFATAIAATDHWDFGPARGDDPSATPHGSAASAKDDVGSMPRCVYTHDHYDWGGDRPPQHAPSERVIYETHVRGATIHPGSGVAHPGTYLGLVERIPYFRDLGITTLELMPVQEFNENGIVRVNPQTGERLRNYWGYNPVAFFAPKGSYSSAGSAGEQVREFKQMVQAFHQAGIEVILDIVLNHTAEGNQLGPTICLRGFDNSIFYMLEESDRRLYRDFTGTGNTMNANHPVVREFIRTALRYWVTEMHVDGFRFDLASVLGRGEDGHLLLNPPLLDSIAEDPILRDVKLIAEAWDEGGAYQVGNFSERRWAEWNGHYRDDVRRFWLGRGAGVGAFASRLCGSSDLYQASGKTPACSVNFVTAHDGFTLNDLVSYNDKYNEANGEDNRDGHTNNLSWNYGVEGPTDDPEIVQLRERVVARRYAWPLALEPMGGARSDATIDTDVVTRLQLRAGEPYVRVRIDLDNHSRDHRLRWHIPLPSPTRASAAEGQFAVVERGLTPEGGHGEVPLPTYPARGFVHAAGVSVLLEHVTEYELVNDGRELAITLLRSIGLISRNANPYREDPAGPQVPVRDAQLIGPRSFGFALVPHAGSWSDAGIVTAAERYQHPLVAYPGTSRDPAIDARQQAGVSVAGSGVVMTALRRRDGWLELRLVAEHPSATEAVVRGPFQEARRIGLPGRALGPIACSGSSLRLPLRAWEIATIRLR